MYRIFAPAAHQGSGLEVYYQVWKHPQSSVYELSEPSAGMKFHFYGQLSKKANKSIL